jgi:hypothetical protein
MGIDEGLLTTADVLKAVEDATGVRFSVHQLGDWVTEGLLPPSRPGHGRGKPVGGTDPRLWQAECVLRLIVIARTRTGKNISVHRAASALADAGYSPGPKHLRALLFVRLAAWRSDTRAPLEWNRPFLKESLSPEEKRKRFHRSDQRRYGATVDPALRAIVERLKLVVLGLADSTDGDPLEKVVAAFTSDQVLEALRASSDEEGAFQTASVLAPAILPPTRATYTLLIDNAEPLKASLRPRDAEEYARVVDLLHDLVSADPADFAAKLRVPFTLLIVYLTYLRRKDPAAVDTLVTQMDAGIHRLFATLTQSMEESARATLREALASVMSSAIEMPGSQTEQEPEGAHPDQEVREEQAKPDLR